MGNTCANGCVERQNTEVCLTENDVDNNKLREDSAYSGTVDKKPEPVISIEPASEKKSTKKNSPSSSVASK